MNFRDTGTRAHGAQRAVRRSSWKAPSRTVTWYLLGKPRSGGSGAGGGGAGTVRAPIPRGGRRAPSPGPTLSPSPPPGASSPAAASPARRSGPMGPEVSPAALRGAPSAARVTPRLPAAPPRSPLSPGKLQRQKLGVPGAAGAAGSPPRCRPRSRGLWPARRRGLRRSGPRWPRTQLGRARLGFHRLARAANRSWRRDSGQQQV